MFVIHSDMAKEKRGEEKELYLDFEVILVLCRAGCCNEILSEGLWRELGWRSSAGQVMGSSAVSPGKGKKEGFLPSMGLVSAAFTQVNSVHGIL